MAALVHFAVGFASKPATKKVPVGLLVAAAWFLDILAIGLPLVGVSETVTMVISHGLFMSAAWSILATAAFWLIYRSFRTGLLAGALVFSHWLIDFVTHPMGAVYGGALAQPDLPLLFAGSPKVGLGLYNHSPVLVYVIEFASIALGIGVYVATVVSRRRKARAAAGA